MNKVKKFNLLLAPFLGMSLVSWIFELLFILTSVVYLIKQFSIVITTLESLITIVASFIRLTTVTNTIFNLQT